MPAKPDRWDHWLLAPHESHVVSSYSLTLMQGLLHMRLSPTPMPDAASIAACCREFQTAGLPVAQLPSAKHTGFAAVVWQDSLYVHGGQQAGQEMATLLAFDLAKGSWQLLHHKQQLSYGWPEGRHGHQMWASGGSLFILGGSTPRECLPPAWLPDWAWAGCLAGLAVLAGKLCCAAPGLHVERAAGCVA
jgi:hypothetical protein